MSERFIRNQEFAGLLQLLGYEVRPFNREGRIIDYDSSYQTQVRYWSDTGFAVVATSNELEELGIISNSTHFVSEDRT